MATLEKWWDHKVPPGHQCLTWHHQEFPETKNYRSFAVVRNTYERLVSLTFKKIGYWSEEYFRFKVMEHTGDWAPADELMFGVDHVLRYENLCHDFFEMLRKENLVHDQDIDWVKMEHRINKNRMGHRPYLEYYTPELVELVKKHYESELAIFGYSAPDVKEPQR
jgi:hypothetical protein